MITKPSYFQPISTHLLYFLKLSETTNCPPFSRRDSLASEICERTCLFATQEKECSNQLHYKDLTFGADQFVEFILTCERIKIQNDDVNCGNNLKYEGIIPSFKLFPQYTSSFCISPLLSPSINIVGGVLM